MGPKQLTSHNVTKITTKQTSLFCGRSQASSQGLSGLLVAASSRILSLRSRTSIQWKSSHLLNVHASICLSSSSSSACEQERSLFIKAWHSAGCNHKHHPHIKTQLLQTQRFKRNALGSPSYTHHFGSALFQSAPVDLHFGCWLFSPFKQSIPAK